jgi:hypothetical protein
MAQLVYQIRYRVPVRINSGGYVILFVHAFADKVTMITIDTTVRDSDPDIGVAFFDIPSFCSIDVGILAGVLPTR